MRKGRFSEAQIADHRDDQGSGSRNGTGGGLSAPWAEPGHVSHKLKARYGGMDVSDAQRLKALGDENGTLKRLLADAMPDTIVLKDLPGKP